MTMIYDNFAEQIKSAVTVLDVCEMYGIELHRGNFVYCPFHNEKTPSLKVYKGKKGFYCFGCGKGGDVITFVQGYLNISYADAVKKLNYDFGLGLPLERKLTMREKYEFQRKEKERQQRLKAKKEAEKRRFDRYQRAYAKWIELDKKIREFKPKNPDEPLDIEFIKALRDKELVEIELEEAESEVMKYESCD